MGLSSLSIKRPAFITSIVFAMLAVGYMCMKKLPVDLFPNITFPVVTVTVPYPGAGPQEIETLVAKVLENELSTVPGIKTLSSVSKEGVANVVAQFTLETDVKYAEQQIRDRVSTAKRKLPTEVQEPIIRRIDPADQPIMVLSVKGKLPLPQLYEITKEEIKPLLEQINQVGLVDITGGRKREIHIDLNPKALKKYELSASGVANRIQASGQNIPMGKLAQGEKETVFRSLGEFHSLEDINNTIVNFIGNDVPVTVKDVGQVVDDLQDPASMSFVNGEPSISVMVFRQSGSNTVKVTDAVRASMDRINKDFANREGSPQLSVVRDTSKMIRANLEDVEESILLGILLTIVVVFLFLGNVRSTLITGLALPNSLLGAFILMSWAGFSINVMSLLALSLSVGLLVDDAIVVRENIFRHMEMGKKPVHAALFGTQEVTLAVIATTLCVLAVFGPIGFLQGIVGQFFKEFGLTICFAMLISLFDALTVAPMLSAYFAGDMHKAPGFLERITLQPIAKASFWVQDRIEDAYTVVLRFTLKHPILITVTSIALFIGSLGLMQKVPKTFMSAQDFGEFQIGLELPQGTSLDKMGAVAKSIDEHLHTLVGIKNTVLTVGNRDGQSNVAEFFVELVPSKERKMNTTDFKEMVRQELKAFAYANPIVKDIDMVGGGQRPFNVNISGENLKEVEDYANMLYAKLKVHPGLKDVDMNNKPGKPESQIILDRTLAEKLGVSSNVAGMELRTLMEGQTPAVFRENGREYDIRVRLDGAYRDLAARFEETYVPNINFTLVKLSNIAKLNQTVGPATINRQDRGRYLQISADVSTSGPGMSAVMADIDKITKVEHPMPPTLRYSYVGAADSFRELIGNMLMAIGLSILFTYLVLSSLYESFVTPFTIMSVLPLAAAGAFAGLYVMNKNLDINSMIGCILLFGLASKNSILLVDYANQKVAEGLTRDEAMMASGKTRLRPILMTTLCLIAGMLPIAIGLNEASRQRTSMGVAIIGGLISSTLLSLIIVPAVYSYIDRFREWSNRTAKKLVGAPQELEGMD